MKAFILTIACLVAVNIASAQLPAFKWAKGMGGTYDGDQGNGITTDAAGNVYTTGQFYGTADFDPGPGVVNLNAIGDGDIFISKLDAFGNFIWAKSLNATSGKGQAIATDAAGNIHILGDFSGTADFDPGVGVVTITAVGDRNMFILKLDATGNFIWVKNMGGVSSGIYGMSIAIHSSGNVFTTGGFYGTVDFDPGISTLNLSAEAYQKEDVFIVNLDASGNLIWAKNIGGAAEDIGSGVALDVSGNVYVIGSFEGTVDFDPTAAIFNLTPAGDGDIFISKFNAAGILVWAKNIGGVSGEFGNAIAVDALANAYLTGDFSGTADFDPNEDVVNLTAAGDVQDLDVFIAKLTTSGDLVWAKNIGGLSYDRASSLAIDAGSNVYTTGNFQGTADFDPGLGTANLTASVTDAFVSKLDASGNFVWAGKMGGSSYVYGCAITVDALNNIYTTGYFYGTADFDPDAGIANLTTTGNADIFVHKMGAATAGINTTDKRFINTVYPTYTKDIVYVIAPETTTGSTIKIYNSLGALIYEQTGIKKEATIDLSNQKNGLYIVTITSKHTITATQKIVKQ